MQTLFKLTTQPSLGYEDCVTIPKSICVGGSQQSSLGLILAWLYVGWILLLVLVVRQFSSLHKKNSIFKFQFNQDRAPT